MTTLDILQLATVGLFAGSVGALFGIGGGIVLVPVLTQFFGLPIRAAVGASLISVVAVSVAGSMVHARGNRIAFSDALQLQFFAVFGALVAGFAAGRIPARVTEMSFGVLMLIVAVLLVRGPNPDDEPTEDSRQSAGLASLASLGSGVIAGILGVGGGVINTPVLHLLMRRPLKIAIATSTYMIGMTAAAAALVYLLRGDIPLELAVAVMTGAFLGAALAAFWGQMISNRHLKAALAGLMIFEAARMFLRV